MKLTRIVFIALSFFASVACSSGIANRPDELGLEVPRFSIPEPTRWTLPNGLEVYYYHNEELPVMRARLYIEGGSLYDTFGVPGIAAVVGSQLREGGTRGYQPDALDDYLDRMAASIESGMGDEYGTVSMFSLSEDFDEIFPLFATVVRYPSFSEKRLSLWKNLSLEQIRRRQDNPGTVAGMVFTEQLYGRGSKFAEYSTAASVMGMSRKLLKDYHSRYYLPQRSKLAISGSLPESEVRKAIKKAFGDWSATATVGELKLPSIKKAPMPGVYLVRRQLDQATISLGHLGPPRHTDDYYSIRVFSEIFGSSGFSSTLFQEIRTKQGLAYSVYGGVWPSLVAGTFQVGLQTRKQEAISAVDSVMKLSKIVREEEPDLLDFSEAQSSVERSFVFKFAKPESIVDRAVMLDTLKYPEDFDARYLERISAVQSADVMAAANKWIKLDKMVVVIVGDVEPAKIAERFPSMPVYSVEFDTKPGEITLLHKPKGKV